MIRSVLLTAVILASAASASAASARTVCTAVAEAASGRLIVSQGDCATRVTPASTFKVPLSLMGYDAGILIDAENPSYPFQEGYVDWGGDNWRQRTNPRNWMKFSVVWFSQQIARALGEDKLRTYATAFGYGNADFSGDPGKGNGLERAWISSSLTISPLEQVEFLRKLVCRSLPVSTHAIDMTQGIVERTVLPEGWTVQGKTGTAYPRMADGTSDRTHAWGWYVGWAAKEGSPIVFAHLIQDEQADPRPAGLRARDSFFKSLPDLVSGGPGPGITDAPASDKDASPTSAVSCDAFR